MAVKPRQYCFRIEILPAQLICTFFEMQSAKKQVTKRDGLSPLFGQDLYLSVSWIARNYSPCKISLLCSDWDAFGFYCECTGA